MTTPTIIVLEPDTSYVDMLYRAYQMSHSREEQSATGFLEYLETQRLALNLVERAMDAEGIPVDTQQRILRRVLTGGPTVERN